MRHMLSALGLCLLTTLAGCSSSSDDESPDQSEQIPLPTFAIDTALEPHLAVIAGIDSGPDRPLGSVSGPTGGQADFVLNELAVLAKDKSRVEALATRWGGKIVKEVRVGDISPTATNLPSYYLLRIDPAAASADGMPRELQKLDKGAHGAHRVSSDAALRLLAAATHEARLALGDGDFQVGVNFVLESSGFWEGSTQEASTGANTPIGDESVKNTYSSNPYAWNYMKQSHVPEAWNALVAAGKLGNKVKMLILDGGFVQNPEFPPGAKILPANSWKTMNPASCTSDAPCPWHATDTVAAAMGQADNGFGAAGPAAPIADLIAVQSPTSDVFQVMNYLFQGLFPALGDGPRVINISATVKVPGSLGVFIKPVDWMVTLARGHFGGKGALLFAAAGNTEKNSVSQDVDHEDNLGPFRWESDVFLPCEVDDAVCIGGSRWTDLHTIDPGSNWGHAQRVRYQNLAEPGHQDNSVDFFAPFDVLVGPQPDSKTGVIPPGAGARYSGGTSVASPFAAGIAALVFAADPSLSADEAYGILLETASDDSEKLELNAYAAVKKALSKSNNPPQIELVSPTSGASIGAGFQGVSFDAQVKDFEDGPDGVTIDWTSDKEGAIGDGTTFTHVFQVLGLHTITVTATDKGGASTQETIQITLTDAGPTASINQPIANQTVERGAPVTVDAAVLSNFAKLPCSWTSSVSTDAGFPYASCFGSVSFATNGWRTLTVTGKDDYGIPASASVTINVVDPKLNAPPTVTISSPAPEQGILNTSTVQLVGNASDPDGKTPLSYEWRFKGDNCPQEMSIASGATASWSPAQSQICGTAWAGGGTIYLYVTDPDNMTTVQPVHVLITVNPF